MSYCFINYRPAREGHAAEPNCPAGVGYVLLAGLPGLEWGLFDVQDSDAGLPGKLVGDELADLIDSAKRYPPALGLAREEMGLVFGGHHPNQVEFIKAYRSALRTHLSRQHEAPYILAPATVGEAGRLTEGGWYWILKIAGTPAVASWVSDDFQICENDMNDFDLTGRQMKRLGYTG